ncbi:P-II family nitrogen regulator [Halomonas sp. BC04]|uniref:P-II family nitrogen regulator n=1 Tax=Halomonas sp. BC04 TaxID=1403540 RepID=UPI001E286E5E|nr:P-II family nitrogen regulator [Halomonas sp. BC04]
MTTANPGDHPHGGSSPAMEFKLIMLMVDESKTDQAMEASRHAGATGATIISNARGQGLEQHFGLFGLEILSPRNVILILVEARRCVTVMQAIVDAIGLDESLETGIALELDVNRALGLKEHIAKLSEQRPLD